MDEEKLIKRKRKAKSDGNLKQLAEIVKELGDLYYEEGKLKAALNEYQQQLQICQILNDKLSIAVAHRMIGEVLTNQGDYEEALIHQNLYVEGAEEAENLLEEQRAFATLGRTYFCYSESIKDSSEKSEILIKAKKAYSKSLRLCDRLQNTNIKLQEMVIMRSRLLLNLGLILEAQRNFEEAINLMKKAETLCIKHKLDEDLHRVYLALAVLYERQNFHEKTVLYFQKATNVDNVILKSEAKFANAEFFLRMGDWYGARKILVSLYVTKGLSDQINESIEKTLRIVVTLMNAEFKLSKETDLISRQKLYESLGDASVAVQCFDKAIEYYKNMWECAQKTGKEQSAALVSLAQTLLDANKIDEAIIYAREELKLHSEPREICRSALYIADLLISLNAPDSEVREHFELALCNAKKSSNVSLHISTLTEFLIYLEKTKCTAEAEKIKKELQLLQNSIIDIATGDDGDDEKEDMDIGADICLEELSDIEELLNNSNEKKRKRTKRRLVVKRNEKGETLLHVACINGKIENVEKLLTEGHPTNVRDHCGWTPLHEAANHGYVEIAKLLIDHGADVNDPGGPLCGGVTPLHDAATCGNMSIMYLLMENNANINLRTQEGDTILDCLEAWRQRAGELSDADQRDYAHIHNQLLSIKPLNVRKKNKKSPTNSGLSNLIDDDDKDIISAGEDYKRTIANLKNRGRILEPSTRTKNASTPKKVAPLLDDECVIDNWLEDDMGTNVRRRSEDSSTTINKRKSDSLSNSEIQSDKKKPRYEENVNINKNEGNLILFDEDSWDSNKSDVSEVVKISDEKPLRKKRVKQINLLVSGFTRSISPNRSPSPISINRLQCSNKQLTPSYLKNLQIFVEEKVFNLKIRFPEEEKRTISSIANDIATKFYNETGCKINLILKAMNGNTLLPDNDLSMLKNCDELENLNSEIIDIDVPSIVQRYSTICKTYNITPQESTIKCLKSCENTFIFRLKPEEINSEELIPLLKSLEYQKQLQVLYLSGGTLLYLGEQLNLCMKLPILQEVHLRGCDIDYGCLSRIEKLPPQLRVLDLSYNPLKSESEHILFKLLNSLKYLQTLNLSCCDLSKFKFDPQENNLVSLDISWNSIEFDDMDFLQQHISNLNLSNTLHSRYSLSETKIFQNLKFFSALETIELCFCDISDSDVDSIISFSSNLVKILLNGNPKLTVKSVNKLLCYKPTLRFIDVGGCKFVNAPPDAKLSIVNPSECNLIVSMEPEFCESWLSLWQGYGIIERLLSDVVIFKPK